jgi:signal transduction histidine kinase/CheY-like chemotaxis protein
MSVNIKRDTFPIYDKKEISKRTYQLGFTAMLVALLICIYEYSIGLNASSLLVGLFCMAIGALLYLNYKTFLDSIKLPIVLMVSAFLIASAIIEGEGTGQYLYFFPLLVVVPIIVDNSKAYYREVFTYFAITLSAATICIIIGHNIIPYQTITLATKTHLLYTNVFSALTLTTCFAFVNIYFERKYLQELIQQKNLAISTRTKFLSVMGHELRTPLNGIIGAINILKHESSLPAQQEYIDILKYCADHLLHQVNDILDFNKIEAGKLELHPLGLNLKELLVKSAMPFYSLFEEKGLMLKINIDPELDLVVMVDDVRLIQIINNLFSNAAKFTVKGYVQLTVTLERKSDTAIDIKVMVEDTGLGISESNQRKIFDSFWQAYDEKSRNYTGTGLGLSICLRLLNLMGSTLQVKSKVGKGSTFFFNLNLALGNLPNTGDQSPSYDEDLNGLNILLVDDNQINVVIAKKILTDYKAQVSVAYNGAEALAKLEQCPAFQIILLDLEMPVLSGYEAVVTIKSLYPEIPVLAFTAALLDQEKTKSLLDLGFADYTLKPFQPDKLFKQVLKYANRKSVAAVIKPTLANVGIHMPSQESN